MTVASLQFDTLLAAAARVGIPLAEVEKDGNLYAWVTPENEVVYIGQSTSPARLRNEKGWLELDPSNEILSGIITLLRVNRATARALHYDGERFDGPAWKAIRDEHKWDGASIENLDERLKAGAPSLDEVEELLIRVAVRYGCPIGNSTYHSQWEGPIGRIADTLAALAVGQDTSFAVPGAPNLTSKSPTP